MKRLLVAVVLSCTLFPVVAGCSSSTTCKTCTTEKQFVGHIDLHTDKSITLRNPKNDHVKTFSLNGDTVVEVDGVKIEASKLPAVVSGNSANCRVTVVTGNDNALKIEIRTTAK